MIGVLKYDIKASYTKSIIVFLSYISIASFLMIFFRNYKIINISSFIFGIIALSVITFFTILRMNNAKIYGSQEYLMFTPHEEGRFILVSKIVPNIIWLFVLALIMALSITIIIFSYSDSYYIKQAENFYEINKAYTIIYLIEYLLNIFRRVSNVFFNLHLKITNLEKFWYSSWVGNIFLYRNF